MENSRREGPGGDGPQMRGRHTLRYVQGQCGGPTLGGGAPTDARRRAGRWRTEQRAGGRTAAQGTPHTGGAQHAWCRGRHGVCVCAVSEHSASRPRSRRRPGWGSGLTTPRFTCVRCRYDLTNIEFENGAPP